MPTDGSLGVGPTEQTGLAGRVAIVTGGSRGIGRAVAVALAAEGAAVAIAARTAEAQGSRLPGSLQEVVDEIRSDGGAAIGVRCDVAEPADLDRLVVACRRTFGPADVLVNNAALTVPDRPAAPSAPAPATAPAPGRPVDPRSRLSILDFPVAAYRRAFEVNLFGAYELSQLVLRDMVGLGRGNIVNISSDAAQVPSEGPYGATAGIPLHAYGNSKAALQHLTRTVAYEMAAHGIAVNAVMPSLPVETPGTAFVAGASLGETLPMHRFVAAVLRLCAVAPSELTGGVLYSEDLLDPHGRRRGWLGERYL
jgi:NAD(P)-dependent dehydrogenase (short-subunit alcohol dehydrogenase family)